jgi:hypothetical protein
VRHKEHVFPSAAFERLGWIRGQRAEVGQWTTRDWILVAPCTVHVLGLEEASEICIDTVDRGPLIGLEQILPVRGPSQVFGVRIFA